MTVEELNDLLNKSGFNDEEVVIHGQLAYRYSIDEVWFDKEKKQLVISMGVQK